MLAPSLSIQTREIRRLISGPTVFSEGSQWEQMIIHRSNTLKINPQIETTLRTCGLINKGYNLKQLPETRKSLSSALLKMKLESRPTTLLKADVNS